MSSPIQGMDTIPQQVEKVFGKLFERYLPGWSVNGKYNFQPGASSQQVAAQLNLLMHNGPHKGINDSILKLLENLEDSRLPDNTKSQHLSIDRGQFHFFCRVGWECSAQINRRGRSVQVLRSLSSLFSGCGRVCWLVWAMSGLALR